MKLKKEIILLLFIFIIALFLRFYNLASIPVGFHQDEAIIADNANFILHTGRDTDNNFLPLQTEVFGDYNPTGYAYLAILPIKFFGLTEFATRLPAALFGSLTVFAVFFLAYAIFENLWISVISSALFALSPWDIVLSRSSEETALSIFFVVFGFALLIYSVRKEKIKYLIAGCLTLFISYFMYFTPRLFVPVLYLAFFIPWKYWWKKRQKKFTKLFFGSFIVLGAIAVFLVWGIHGGSSRFNQVSIFGFPETRLVMEEQIREDGVMHTPILITRFFHNKITAYTYTYIGNYLQYFTADFLFIKGGLPVIFKVPQMGLIYLIELPFILFGIYRLIIEKKKWPYFLFAWLLLAPAAAALTVDDIPNVRRALLMAPVLEIFAAYGIKVFFAILPKKFKTVSLTIFVCLFLYNIVYFTHAYFIHAQIHQNWYRDNGYEEMIRDVKQDYNKYDHIIVTKSYGGTFAEILFYMNYDPETYLKEGAPKDASFTGFGKFFFVPQDCPSVNGKNQYFKDSKLILIERGDCPINKWLLKKSYKYILRSDGTKVFRIIYD